MESKRAYRAVDRLMRATDPSSMPAGLSDEEKIRWLEAQNELLRFHYSALLERSRLSSPEAFVKKKR